MRSEGNVYNPKPAEVPDLGSAENNRDMETRAIEIACDIRFHRSFILPAKPEHGREKPIRVTYSDAGRPGELGDGLAKPVILVSGGMFGGRYLALLWDAIAKAHGVRVVAVDRPGIGGTDEVPLGYRIATWLDTVPALLAHLDIKYVSLVAHSAGSMYSLSTVMHLRHVLHPERPYVALFAPWVPPQHSKKWTMQALRVFPAGLISKWDTLAAGVHQYVAPSLAFGRKGIRVSSGARDDDHKGTRTKDEVDKGVRLAVENVVTDYVFNENIHGASDEALLCLGKGKTNWNGLAEAIEKISASEKVPRARGSPLRVQVYYGGDDEMIGTGGETYLDSLLQKAQDDEAIDLDRFKVGGTDHNALLYPDFDAPVVMMEFLGGRRVFEETNWKFCRRKA